MFDEKREAQKWLTTTLQNSLLYFFAEQNANIDIRHSQY